MFAVECNLIMQVGISAQAMMLIGMISAMHVDHGLAVGGHAGMLSFTVCLWVVIMRGRTTALVVVDGGGR